MSDLYRSDTLLVRAVPTADTTRWVVTFDNYGLGPGFEREGFGETFLRQAGVSAIHVMGRGDDWYQYPDTLQAMAAVRQATKGAERVVTYGSSMGAYAALRLADEAGAHAVLAISPQYSIDPARAPFETRWVADARRLAFLPEIERRMTRRTRPVVVYDAAGDDRRHADLIAAEAEITRLGLRHIHHPATTFLQEKGLLAPLILGLVAGDIDTAALREQARRSRRESATCLTLLAERQPPHRPRMALRLAQRAVDVAPQATMALSSLAMQLTRAGDHDAAIAMHERALATGDRGPQYLVAQSHGLVAAGRVAEATAAAAEAAERLPAAAHLRYWTGSLQLVGGDVKSALRSFREASALDPKNAAYRQTLWRTRLLHVGPTGAVVRAVRALLPKGFGGL